MKNAQMLTIILLVPGFLGILGYMLYLGAALNTVSPVVLIMIGVLAPAFTIVINSIWDSGIASKTVQDEAQVHLATVAAVTSKATAPPAPPQSVEQILDTLVDAGVVTREVADSVLASAQKAPPKG
jgi:hypothetical protein